MKRNIVLESTKQVVNQSQHVSINHDAIIKFCQSFEHSSIKHWLDEAPLDIGKLNESDRLNFLLVFNSISFSYWGDPKWTIEYEGKSYDGSWGMIACIGRAIDEGIAILDANYLSNITKEDFAHILRGNVEIPLFDERLNVLRQVGTVLVETFDGEFQKLIDTADGDAQKLLDLLIQHFPSFKDVAEYNGEKVYFYKRAQLLIADIFQAFSGTKYGSLKNVDQLTACADYKLPLILRKMGIMEYSKDLADTIDDQIELESGSQEEVEIRASTIWSVELIKRELGDSVSDATSIHVNDHIWLISQNKSPNEKPYHHTRTTAY